MKINKYEYDDNQKLTNEGNKIIKGLSISALSLIILLNSCSIYNSLVNNNSEKNLEKDSKKITSSSVVASVASNPNYEINYSYVEEFYNNSNYNSNFIEELVVLSNTYYKEDFIVDYIEGEIFLKPKIFQVDALNLIIELMRKELDNEL